jgi:hypothetical protein
MSVKGLTFSCNFDTFTGIMLVLVPVFRLPLRLSTQVEAAGQEDAGMVFLIGRLR